MDYKAELNIANSDLNRAIKLQDLMKKANAIIRGGTNVTQRLIEIGLNENQAEQLQKPDYAGRVGFAQYNLTNNNALIKRLQDKVKNLETKLKGSKAETEERYLFDGGEVFVNYDIDRVQILFPGGRTTKDNFSLLRRNGFVYSPSNKAFQRKITPIAIRTATSLFNAKKVEETELQKGIDVESEHTDTIEKIASGEISPEQAPEEIAKDHLTEDTKYYDKLEEVEGKKYKEDDFVITDTGKYGQIIGYTDQTGNPIGKGLIRVRMLDNSGEKYINQSELEFTLPPKWVPLSEANKERLNEIKSKGLLPSVNVVSTEYFEPNTNEEYIQAVIDNIQDKIPSSWLNDDAREVAVRNEIWKQINKIDTGSSNEEKQTALWEIFTKMLYDARKNEYNYDEDRGRKYEYIIKLDEPNFKEKFGIDKINIDNYLRVFFKFKNEDKIGVDLTLDLKKIELYGSSLNKGDTWKRWEDIKYWLMNALNHYDNHELIMANLKTKNKEWSSHPKGFRMGMEEKLTKNENNMTLREFKDNLSELDIDWQPFTSPNGETRFFRKFLFSPEEQKSGVARQITDLGLTGGWEDKPKGYVSVVVDVPNLAVANEIDQLHHELVVEPGNKLANAKIGFIEPRKITIQIRSDVTKEPKFDFDNYSSANNKFKSLLKYETFSDLNYYITFEDGNVLEGVIDVEPISRWEQIENPLTYHLVNFWGNLSKKNYVKGHPEYQGQEKAKELIKKYDLGQFQQTNNMSDFEKERQRQIASGEISPESKAISLSALSKKINAEKKENLSDLFEKFYEVVTFHEDARHGWLEVPKSWLTKLGIAHEISGFSYQKGDSVFLEEDSDLSTFLNAIDKYIIWSPNLLKKTYKEDSPIRNYAHYKTPSAPKKEVISQPKPTKKAEINLFEGVNETRLRNFIPANQIQTLMQMSKGEEGSEAVDIIQRLDKIVVSMPEPYGSEGVENKLAYLHYFNSSSDWYIIEKDNDGPQKQAFGWVILNGDTINAEYGYVDIDTLIKMKGVELDFYFAPTPIKEIIKKHGGDTMEESENELIIKYNTQFDFKADKLGEIEKQIIDEFISHSVKVFREYGTRKNTLYIQYDNKFFKLDFYPEHSGLDITIIPGLLFGEKTSEINKKKGEFLDTISYEMISTKGLVEKIIEKLNKVSNEEYKQLVESFKSMESPHEKTYANPYELNKAIEKFLDDKKQTLGEDAFLNPDNYTSGEIVWLRQYSGYGGLSQFGPGGKGAFFEYYTPMPVIRKMWALAYKYGYKGGATLEPSVATGEFLSMAPFNAQNVTGYEINPYSWAICKILYPSANIILAPFEKTFIKNNFTMKDKVEPIYELAIGNPPYGSFDVVKSREMSMGELDHVRAKNYAEYFIRRGIDLLMPGGLLIYIVGASIEGGGELFLDSGISPVKEYLAEKCDLLDAYRLPDAIFERTGVTSEIIVLQKK